VRLFRFVCCLLFDCVFWFVPTDLIVFIVSLLFAGYGFCGLICVLGFISLIA